MARRDIIQGQKGADTSAWVVIPKQTHGWNMCTLVHSLISQIEKHHYQKRVTGFRIDAKERKFIIEFGEEPSEKK